VRRSLVNVRPWAAGPEEETEKPEKGVKSELPSRAAARPRCRNLHTKRGWQSGLAEGARLFAIK